MTIKDYDASVIVGGWLEVDEPITPHLDHSVEFTDKDTVWHCHDCLVFSRYTSKAPVWPNA